MSRLTLFTEAGERLRDTDNAAEIASALGTIGVRFERWPLEAYEDRVAALRGDGYTTTDTVSVSPDHPERDAMRAKFLSEHRHAEDEVRFFLAGEGLFTLRDGGHVYAVLCTAGDMISVPAGMRHWFDMGPQPSFTAMRFFRTPKGWVGDFTGDPIADRFPRHAPA
ncbi:1,2-dihydroxy-3-keto-5-methylthiopentene dioxygenase [Sphingomonas sp.]|jgi:1,2-dihydroxy-3-keto-5-methylthiopentene dioxygenase|uniref:1,2-dihydroxy-3-keto-5-methylthiopentene dioxygenase n=1 Tax=Sphingomonas sp. TaxID=28214 RepID=UPI002DF42A8F|nr:cupin domain-containing protein [Sphingomonas sp.]